MSRATHTAAILASLDNWKDHFDTREAGRYVELLTQRLDWTGLDYAVLRRIVEAIAGAADDATLEDMASVADDDQQTFYQCTIGNEIGEALQKVGLNPAQAESIGQDAIRAALDVQHEANKAKLEAAVQS